MTSQRGREKGKEEDKGRGTAEGFPVEKGTAHQGKLRDATKIGGEVLDRAQGGASVGLQGRDGEMDDWGERVLSGWVIGGLGWAEEKGGERSGGGRGWGWVGAQQIEQSGFAVAKWIGKSGGQRDALVESGRKGGAERCVWGQRAPGSQRNQRARLLGCHQQ